MPLDPIIDWIAPASGPMAGNFVVSVFGSNLGAFDVVNASLAGVIALNVSQINSSYVEITAGSSNANVTGDAVIVSTSFGTATLSSAFSYNPGTYRCRLNVYFVF